MKLIKILRDNIIIKGTTKASAIIVENKEANSKRLESLEVIAVGEQVKSVKAGDQVRISNKILFEPERIINPFQISLAEKYGKDNEFYISVKEEEIIGKY